MSVMRLWRVFLFEVTVNLIDLEPRWCAQFGAPEDAKQGVSFQCPHCKAVRLAIFFANPICSNPAADLKQVHRDQAYEGHLGDHHIGGIAWQRSGETFETLTLSPSVDASSFGHWHGWIQNGEVR